MLYLWTIESIPSLTGLYNPDIMKKSILIFLVISASVPESYAGTGNARDGYLFVISLIGILLFFAGIIYLIDFFRKNGKQLFEKIIHHRQTEQNPDTEEPGSSLTDDSKNYINYSC
jgi:hypothetical protein